jgi:hypothetical protein
MQVVTFRKKYSIHEGVDCLGKFPERFFRIAPMSLLVPACFSPSLSLSTALGNLCGCKLCFWAPAKILYADPPALPV